MNRYIILLIGLTSAPLIPWSHAADEQNETFQGAKAKYEQSSHDESSRQSYVKQLAQIAGRLVGEYRASGARHDEEMSAINAELQKHPAPANSDSKKLSQLLAGKWESPRRTYVFRANGKYGTEGGPISGNWRIKGNQLIEDGSRATIILLDSDYFIYSDGRSVFFHSRVKE